MPPRDVAAGQKIKEVWFEGCHSDVGGGLPERKGSLYKHSFEWMVREAQDAELRVDERALDRLLAEPAGPPQKVESLRHAWHLAELAPRLQLQNQFPPRWRRRPTIGLWRGRHLADAHRSGGLTLHASVREQVAADLTSTHRGLKILPEREQTRSFRAASTA